MAFNWQTFKTRTLTAIIFAVVMLAGLLWNQWSFFILFSIIHFGCWWEYLKLIEKIHQIKFHRHLKFGLMLMGYGLMLSFCGPAYQLLGYNPDQNLSFPVSAIGVILLVIGLFQRERITVVSFAAILFGLLYISLCWGLMIDLYGRTQFPANNPNYTDFRFHDWLYIFPPYLYPVLIIISIWINDTMAYIVGSIIGKTPMSKISPKKTWEGTIGGVILSTAVIFLISRFLIPGQYLDLDFTIIAFIASIAGTFGDLFESKLKRMAGVKDSGYIMPGHGGFLDRFDSLLFATPFVWLYIYFFMK